jgi:hypothetical protein
MTTQSEKQKLLPCPFCGGNLSLIEDDEPQFYFMCNKCLIHFNIFSENGRENGIDEAYRKMNTRAITDERRDWRAISTMPTEDNCVFLVFYQGTEGKVIEQVETFEGNIYPSRLGDLIDWDDRVSNATHWMPLPDAPTAAGDLKGNE